MKWAALFSQTGSEICNLSEHLGRYPDLIVTDNITGEIDSRISNSAFVQKRKYRGLTDSEKLDYFKSWIKEYDLVTLHGWLNIVPATICNQFKLYNGHPGLINYHPELKGKDPQVRAWDNIGRYLYVGSVVHKVVPEVDAGDVITYSMVSNAKCDSLDATFDTLKDTSFKAWVEFLGTKL